MGILQKVYKRRCMNCGYPIKREGLRRMDNAKINLYESSENDIGPLGPFEWRYEFAKSKFGRAAMETVAIAINYLHSSASSAHRAF
jgi:hypothetical protein